MKRNITNSDQLKKAIDELEKKVKVQESEIKTGYQQVKEDLKMKKILHNKFEQIAQTPEIQRTLLNTAFGMILGFAAKKMQEVLSEQSLNRTVENILSHSINKLEQNNQGNWISKGITLLRKYTPPESPIYPFLTHKSNYLQIK